MGDFNVGRSNTSVDDFCQLYSLKHLSKIPTTCFENPDNLSAIDLMLTNAHHSFQNWYAIETGSSHFHKMTATVLKTYFKKRILELSIIRTTKTSHRRITVFLIIIPKYAEAL